MTLMVACPVCGAAIVEAGWERHAGWHEQALPAFDAVAAVELEAAIAEAGPAAAAEAGPPPAVPAELEPGA